MDKDDAYPLLNKPGEFLIRSELTKDGRSHIMDIVIPGGKKTSFSFQEADGQFYLLANFKRPNIPAPLAAYKKFDEGVDPAAQQPLKPLYPVISASWVIRHKNVVLDKAIGAGNFGAVWTGVYHRQDGKKVPVAVKINKDVTEKERERGS